MTCPECGCHLIVEGGCKICPNCGYSACENGVEDTPIKARRKRIYIAGAYSADRVMAILDNMRRGMRAGTEVLLAGYAPFVPWLDYHFQLMLREEETLIVEDYYAYSMAWLEASDAVLVLPHSEHSRGTQLEIKRARELNIPIYHSLEELKIAEDI